MKLGIISDEVSADFAEACAHIKSWGLPIVEVRMVNGKNVVQLTDDELAATVATVKDNGLTVSAVASPVYKSPLDEQASSVTTDFNVAGTETVAAQLQMLERACHAANLLGAKYVRIFTFLRTTWSDEVLARVVHNVKQAVSVAQRHGVTLAIENEPACIVGTGEELGLFMRALDAELDQSERAHVGALWDPGNALSLGEERPYPDGYAHIPTDRLVHVHLKDASVVPAVFGTFVPLGQGLIDYPGQFAALVKDGYEGSVVLEPHYAPDGLSLPEAAKACVDAARGLLESAGASS